MAYNLKGNIYGELTVLDRAPNNVLPSGLSERMWVCRCSCGSVVTVRGAFLRTGHTKSCGCIKSKYIDLVGSVINGIEFIRFLYVSKNGGAIWLCKCHCGLLFCSRASDIKSGHKKSCGCRKKQLRIKESEMIGKKFTRLVVLSRASDRINPNGTRSIRWNCLCSCGRKTVVLGTALRYGSTRSCGCKSLAEFYIEQFLIDYGTNFETQYKFSDLYYSPKHKLSYDFAVFNGEKILLIECQGVQHYFPVNIFGGESVFKIQKIRDQLKYDYVQKHDNLFLLEIPNSGHINQSKLISIISRKLAEFYKY